MADEFVLQINDLSVSFDTMRGEVRSVQHFSLAIKRGEVFALVGESGCGKSVTAQTINQIVPCPPGKIRSGSILFEGKDILQMNNRELQNLRGARISMIFQEPMTSLNPVFTIGFQLSAVFMEHSGVKKTQAWQQSTELLELVQIPDAPKQMHRYPHQLSGGMQQRVMIAMALASPNPCLLIADEPTTALDSTTQIQILALLKILQREKNLSILLITHDMGVVAQYADRVAVMYAGRKMEEGNVESVFACPSHPYTRGLLNSLPKNPSEAQKPRLESIEGSVPDLRTVGDSCPFYSRCQLRTEVCLGGFPGSTVIHGASRAALRDHTVWCHNYGKKRVNSRGVTS